MKGSEIYSKVENTLERTRNHNRKISEQRKDALLKRFPEIADLNAQFLQTVLLHSQKNLKSISYNTSDLKKRKREINRNIEEILTSNGYPEDYLDQVYQCGKCKDTGYAVNGNIKSRCECFFIYMTQEIYSIPELTLPKGLSFESYDESLFDGYDSSLKQQKSLYMSSVKNILETFCEEHKYNNYYIFGKTGTGKTFFLVSTAIRLLEKKVPSLYITANNLFKITQEYKASVYSDEKPDPYLYGFIYSTRILIIDDLGSESITPSKYAELLEILNYRSQKERPTLIASNLAPLDLKKMYDERIYSRIIGSFDSIRLPGDDLRLVIKRRDKRS